MALLFACYLESIVFTIFVNCCVCSYAYCIDFEKRHRLSDWAKTGARAR